MAVARQGRPGNRAKPFAGVGGWRCPRLWPGATIVCLAGGPSLTADDVARVRAARNAGAVRVATVNDALRLAPWTDVAYAADSTWWSRVGAHVETEALKVSCQASEFRQVKVLRYRPGPIVETDPQWIATGRFPGPDSVMIGGNSGYQAVNLAVHLGARRIVLLGYDMGAGPEGEIHWFGRHPHGMNNPGPKNFAAWARGFDRLAPELAALGVEVVNASRRTALSCFPRVPLEEVLTWA